MSYGWVIRIMGFLVLFNSAIILLLARPKTMHRPRAPLFDMEAWKDLTYCLFAVGIFCVCWGLYFAYFYVCTYVPLLRRDQYNIYENGLADKQ